MAGIELSPVEGLGEIGRADDVAGMICAAVELRHHDVVVVTQKIVSKAEGAMAQVDPDDPLSHKPLVERESVRILRRRGELIISETKHGFVCANAGIDLSNVDRGQAALLPDDPDRSARRIRDGIRGRSGVEVGVIVSDTFGRPWRRGVSSTTACPACRTPRSPTPWLRSRAGSRRCSRAPASHQSPLVPHRARSQAASPRA